MSKYYTPIGLLIFAMIRPNRTIIFSYKDLLFSILSKWSFPSEIFVRLPWIFFFLILFFFKILIDVWFMNS